MENSVKTKCDIIITLKLLFAYTIKVYEHVKKVIVDRLE